MTNKKKPLPAEPQDNAPKKGVPAELKPEDIANLAGFFDVLIQMDLANKILKEIRSKKK